MSIDRVCQLTCYRINEKVNRHASNKRNLCQATEIRETCQRTWYKMKLHVKRHVTRKIKQRSMSSDIAQMKLRVQNGQRTIMCETTDDKEIRKRNAKLKMIQERPYSLPSRTEGTGGVTKFIL